MVYENELSGNAIRNIKGFFKVKKVVCQFEVLIKSNFNIANSYICQKAKQTRRNSEFSLIILFYYIPVMKQFWICHYLNCRQRRICLSSDGNIKFHGRMVQYLVVIYSTFYIILWNFTEGLQKKTQLKTQLSRRSKC